MLRTQDWITIVIQVVAFLIALITALWAYTKFVIERAILPPTDFTVEANIYGPLEQSLVVEIILHLKNVGASTLIAQNIRVDPRYITEENVRIGNDPSDKLYGRLIFDESVKATIVPMRDAAKTKIAATPVAPGSGRNNRTGRRESQLNRGPVSTRGFLLLGHDTFVEAGVDQTYSFTTAIPAGTKLLLVWASFEYAQRPRRVQRGIVTLSRKLGLIQYSLTHVRVPHTLERVFKVSQD